MSHRTPANVTSEPPTIHVGRYRACPECGAKPVRCSYCGDARTDFLAGVEHHPEMHPGYVFQWTDHLKFIHGTGSHYCLPHNRAFVSLFVRCSKPGVHVHQKCQNYGWRGVGLITPESDGPGGPAPGA
jgi:hypothetical protein